MRVRLISPAIRTGPHVFAVIRAQRLEVKWFEVCHQLVLAKYLHESLAALVVVIPGPHGQLTGSHQAALEVQEAVDWLQEVEPTLVPGGRDAARAAAFLQVFNFGR